MHFIEQLGEVDKIIDIVKIFFVSFFTYYTALKIINHNIKNKSIKMLIMIITTIIIAIVSKVVKENLNFFYTILIIILSNSVIFMKETKISFAKAILIITISLSINYILLFIGILASFIFLAIIKVPNDYISLLIIITTYGLILYFTLRVKRFSKGISFLKDKLNNEYLDILTLNISVIILFAITILSNYNLIVSRTLGTGFIIISIIMFITIQKSLQIYYKQTQLEKALDEANKTIEKQDKKIKEITEENLEFIKTAHSISHKQKSLERKLKEIELNSEIAKDSNISQRINKLSEEIYKEKAKIEIDKTGIEEIDDILAYMQDECSKKKIDFQIQLNGNIHKMINNYVSKEKLEILLADHIKNAIIAIEAGENTNRNILVRLGLIDGFYGIYVYDSGIEFEIDTLQNLGIKPSTTHKDNGGTGMGFMNTFDTLKEYSASLEIEEIGKPNLDNYTKVLKIKFDKKSEYKIKSYREKEIDKNIRTI